MKIQVLSAMYGRHEAVNMAVDSWLKEDLDVLMVVSNEEDRKFCIDKQIDYIHAPNTPLSNKWQSGITFLKDWSDADAFLILGSDDIIKGSENYKTYLFQGYEFIGITDIYVQDLKTKEKKHWKGYTNHRRGETAGAGRCFSRSLLDKLDWTLWTGNINSGLDFCVTQRLKKVNYKSITLNSSRVEITDLKDKYSVTPFHRFK